MAHSARLRVLLVDDDETTLSVHAALLESAGHEVLVRSAALGTTATIGREHPDVVILDVHMPGLTGDRLASLIAAQGGEKAPFVVLVSSLPEAELDALVRASGANAAIQKTEDPSAFIRRFQELAPLARKLHRATA
jgi:CheY-like chemotaxis protein